VRLQAYAWPGNIRELEHALTYAVTYFESTMVLPEHLPPEVGDNASADVSGGGPLPVRYRAPEDSAAERSTLLKALESCGGNRTKAAEQLGMCRATLWIKLRGIDTKPVATDDTI
jgi:transcriptional regulator of acetoin/glycerol metabolism